MEKINFDEVDLRLRLLHASIVAGKMATQYCKSNTVIYSSLCFVRNLALSKWIFSTNLNISNLIFSLGSCDRASLM